ncbi:MAG: polyprenol monophosphomannose synthase [Micromonosporaceae bacterium]|nr:polyprenol monophosphomannose synthase [Micromonosporaceae bacterium]
MTVAHPVPAVELPAPWSDAAVVVVVPTYNEAANVEEALTRLDNLPLPNLRVIVVDDGSPDGTADAVESFGKRLQDRRASFVTVIRRTSKDGLGRAYAAGMAAALADGAQFIVQMDADLSHQPEYIPQMLGVMMSTTAGVVIGSRYVPGGSLANEWKFHRRLLSGWANFYVNTILGLGVRDATAGFKLWRRELLEQIDLDQLTSAGYSFQVEMNYLSKKAGYPLVEVPIHFEERHGGVSKMSLAEKLESARVPFKLRLRHR